MKGLNHFIIELKIDFKDTFTTEGGLELYMNKSISQDKLSNRIAKVISTPCFHETVIKEGYQVMIDPTILYNQIYQGIKQDSINIVDKKKGWYMLEPKEVILYREDSESEWIGYLENSLVEPVIETIGEQKVGEIIISTGSKQLIEGRATAKYMSKDIEAKNGDNLVINKNGGIPFWIDGKEFHWIRAIDIYATI